jgi:Short C-terminal domain
MSAAGQSMAIAYPDEKDRQEQDSAAWPVTYVLQLESVSLAPRAKGSKMGLIRKSLYLTTGGVVAPNSKKQRLQMQQLAALQGATPEEIKRAGGRDDPFGLPPASVTQKATAGQPSGTPRRPCTCGAPVRCIMGRYWDEDGFEHQCPGPPEVQSQARPAIEGSDQETTILLSCGHTTLIADPHMVGWLSVEGALSYRCPICDAERAIVTINEDAASESEFVPDETAVGEFSQLIDELERLAALRTSGALTDTEFQTAKARLLGTA